MVKCPYSVLEVARDADDASIKKAYRKLALLWHPDKNPGDDNATTRFQEIGSAYAILSNAEKREYYDRTGQSKDDGDEDDFSGGGFGAGFNPMEFADVMRMFSDMFGDVDGFTRDIRGGSHHGTSSSHHRNNRFPGPGAASASRGFTTTTMNMNFGGSEDEDEWFDIGFGGSAPRRDAGGAGRTASTTGRGKKKKRKKGRGRMDDEAIFEQFLEGLMANSDSEDEDVTEELFSDFVEKYMTVSDVRGRKRYCCEICNTEFRKMDTLVSHLDEAHKTEFERFIVLNADSSDDSDDDAFDIFTSADPFGHFSGNPMRHPPRSSRPSFAADLEELDHVMEMMMGAFPSTAPFRIPGAGNPRRPTGAPRSGFRQTRQPTATQSARNARSGEQTQTTDTTSDSSKRAKPNRRRRNAAQQRAAAKR